LSLPSGEVVRRRLGSCTRGRGARPSAGACQGPLLARPWAPQGGLGSGRGGPDPADRGQGPQDRCRRPGRPWAAAQRRVGPSPSGGLHPP